MLLFAVCTFAVCFFCNFSVRDFVIYVLFLIFLAKLCNGADKLFNLKRLCQMSIHASSETFFASSSNAFAVMAMIGMVFASVRGTFLMFGHSVNS